MKVEEILLTASERYMTDKPMQAICLHHTAGWDDPAATVKCWQNDKIGRIGTHYVIGGQNIKNTTVKHDGRVVRCIPDKGWNAWHLGGGPSGQNHVTVGIELCSAGSLKASRTGSKTTWFGVIADESQITKLQKPFRGSSYYHKYSTKQIEMLKDTLLHLANTHGIDIREGLITSIKNVGFVKALEQPFSTKIVSGLYSHTNFRKDKSDVFPQLELEAMLTSL